MSRKQAETRNMLIAMMLSVMVLAYWNYYIEAPRQKAEIAAIKAKQQIKQKAAVEEEKLHPIVIKPRTEIIKDSPRVTINSPSLKGSLSLTGLRFDDLMLTYYRETLDKTSPDVTLLSPPEDTEGYFAEFGWADASKTLKLPAPDTLWISDGTELTPEKPVTLSWKSSDGITFTAKIALDDKYMFTVTQTAIDGTGKPLSLQTYAYVNRVYDIKKHPPLGILHEGPVGVVDNTLKEAPYKKLSDEKDETFEASNGWLGVTDKYWLAAIIPQQEPFTAHFSYYNSRGRDHYQADYLSTANVQNTLHFFAGAKS